MVVGVRYRDGKSATKAHAILRTLDSNSVVAIFVHVAALSARAGTDKFRSCPLRSNNEHFCAGAANDAKGHKQSLRVLLPGRSRNLPAGDQLGHILKADLSIVQKTSFGEDTQLDGIG
jgi:hypothetical protein